VYTAVWTADLSEIILSGYVPLHQYNLKEMKQWQR